MKEHNYLLRGIPWDLWKRIKHYCFDNDKTVRGLILELLENEVKEREDIGKSGNKAVERTQWSKP